MSIVPPTARMQQPQSRIRRAELPRSHNVYWSSERKAQVVRAVRDNLITFDEARWKYLLSRREFENWKEEFETSRAPERELELH